MNATENTVRELKNYYQDFHMLFMIGTPSDRQWMEWRVQVQKLLGFTTPNDATELELQRQLLTSQREALVQKGQGWIYTMALAVHVGHRINVNIRDIVRKWAEVARDNPRLKWDVPTRVRMGDAERSLQIELVIDTLRSVYERYPRETVAVAATVA
jgi:hypothetical protein